MPVIMPGQAQAGAQGSGGGFMDWLLQMLPEQMAQTGVAPPTGPVGPPPMGGVGAPPPPVPGTTTPMIAGAPPTPGAPILPNISQYDLLTAGGSPTPANPSGTSTAWMGGGASGSPAPEAPAAEAAKDPLIDAMDSLAQVKAPAGPETINPSTPSLPGAKQIDLSPLLQIMQSLGGGQQKQAALPFLTNLLGQAPQR